MTDTPEAVRLADELELLFAAKKPYPTICGQTVGSESWRLTATGFKFENLVEAAALLRRIPELEAERDRLSAALATHPAQAQQVAGEVLTESYVQTVPDKCDRIVWRGYYYTLPPTPPAQPAAPPTKVANPYSGVGQVSEGWCRANPGLAAMAINRLSAWLNELQQDQAAGPPPTPPAQQKGGEA